MYKSTACVKKNKIYYYRLCVNLQTNRLTVLKKKYLVKKMVKSYIDKKKNYFFVYIYIMQ